MKPVDDLDLPQFYSADVCKAARISAVTLRNWIGRLKNAPVALGPHDRPASGAGNPTIFTLRRVYQIALMADLVRLGIKPAQAALAALKFSDGSDGAEMFGITGNPEIEAMTGRAPGELYGDFAYTLLVVYPQYDGQVYDAHVIGMDADTRMFDLLHSSSGVHRGALIMNVTVSLHLARQELGMSAWPKRSGRDIKA